MKKQLLLATLLISFSFMQAQNIFFKKFGTSADVVRTFLQTRNNLNFILDTDEMIIASTGNMVMTYHFGPDGLYQTMLQKTFETRKECLDTHAEVESYYDLLRANVVEMENSKTEAHFIAEKNREVHEVLRVSTKDDNRLQMVTYSLDLSPKANNSVENTPLISMANW
ncbi:MAG: hypothetical protein H6581_15290 [Bacteroidia bacterium]|nr:hypothetical protein [Bacteroidia bacterium]